MLLSPRKKGLDSLFKEVRVFKVQVPEALQTENPSKLPKKCKISHPDSPEKKWKITDNVQKISFWSTIVHKDIRCIQIYLGNFLSLTIT